jgi:hypothetical protein
MSAVESLYWCHLCRVPFSNSIPACSKCEYELTEEFSEDAQSFFLDLSSLPVVESSVNSDFMMQVMTYLNGGTFIPKNLVNCLEDCPICYETMTQAVQLGCNHRFHEGCIDPWLENHSSCPLCRLTL